MNALKLLGTGLLKKDKKINREFSVKKNAKREKRLTTIEKFIREKLGTRLIQIEKKI